MYTFEIVSFSIASAICFLYLVLFLFVLNETNPKNNSALVRLGAKLIFFSGLLLGSLQTLVHVIEKPSEREQLCEIYFTGKISMPGIEELQCEELLNNVWIHMPEWLSVLFVNALTWIIPIVFASVGVNALSQGLINQGSETNRLDNFLETLPKPLGKLLGKILSSIREN